MPVRRRGCRARRSASCGSCAAGVASSNRNTQGRNDFLRAGVRPATPLICAFIDEHKQRFGVVPICRALAVRGVQIAPRTYWAHCSSAPSKRALWDTTITEILAGYYEPDADGKHPPESLYGSLKMWAHLQRQTIPVARRTVERIMRHNGWRGVTRARRAPRTTEPDPAAARAPDLVGRQWRVSAPSLLLVADFTYVPMTRGFGYTAFVVDAYAGVIPGWECSLVKDTGFVERALRHAVAFRPDPRGPPVRRRDPSFRRRKSVHRNTLRRDADAGKADPVDRDSRRRAR